MNDNCEINLKCEICGRDLLSTKSMSHIKLIHKIELKDYYDKFLKKDGEWICPECGKETTYRGVKLGYQKFCSLKCSNNNENRISLFKKSYKNNDMSEIKRKRENTNLLRYGDTNANNVLEIKMKNINTCMKRYGVSHPMMIKTISLKSYSSRKTPAPKVSFKWKDYILPSGKVVKVQGRENKMLDKLLKVFKESDLLIHNGVPTIKYI